MKSRPFQTHLATLPLAAAVLAFSALSGQCANPAYPSVVESDGALGYYRFNDSLTRGNINSNSGSLGAAGDMTNTFTLQAIPGALAGSGDQAQFFNCASWGMIPFHTALNPANTQPFTLEVWFLPTSDQISSGQCPMNNRVSSGVTDRTGWVFFQRAPDDSYTGKSGFEGVGWNCRMYRANAGNSGLDITSGVPYQVGQWGHVVVVYDPVDITNSTLTMYFNGVPANTNVWNGGADGTMPGYVANDPASGAAISLGAYNNTSGAGGNAYFGGADEFAFYAAKLTPEQILAHYQNGTNASRTTPYETLIKSANPLTYLRLNELSPGVDLAINMGDLRNNGNFTNTPALKHPGTSALAGRTGDGSISSHYRDTGATGHALTSIPWKVENNPDAGIPFTLEAWFRPTGDQMNPGPSPINNRLANGIADRTGWVIYQRDPNDSYRTNSGGAVSGESGLGWTFRPYTGSGGSSGGDLQLAAPYNLGEWLHFVVTWEPFQDMGMAPSGSEAFMGVLTGYIDGVPVATNGDLSAFTGPVYAANANPTADGRDPADLAIGSYNAGSGYGEEFEGGIDEVAFYNNYVLKPEQILAHYMSGTNSHSATNYATLVLTAGYDPLAGSPQRTGPKTYLRFSEPAYFPGSNSGSLGYLANSSLVMATNDAVGPTSAGFEPGNTAVQLNGTTKWVSLNNPAGLALSGQITLEAWINPDATQGNLARIISHGPATPTAYDLNTYPLVLSGSQLSSNELFLRIEGSGATYAVGTTDGVTTHGASAAVTAGDLGGANGWIHLAGTYDGSHWNLYRNGVAIANTADATGALAVTSGEWAFGATGMGWGDFYTGLVDEVAIYGTALSAATVQTHYNVGKNGAATAPKFNAPVLSNGVLTISWTGTGTLLQTTNVALPMSQWTTVPGHPTSPYQVTPATAGPKIYYRLQQ